jgi:hypothetical protein
MKPGDKVNWRYESRGGYGYTQIVAAVVVKIGPKRIQVRSAQRDGEAWRQVLRWVNPESLSPREKVVPEVDG